MLKNAKKKQNLFVLPHYVNIYKNTGFNESNLKLGLISN